LYSHPAYRTLAHHHCVLLDLLSLRDQPSLPLILYFLRVAQQRDWNDNKHHEWHAPVELERKYSPCHHTNDSEHYFADLLPSRTLDALHVGGEELGHVAGGLLLLLEMDQFEVEDIAQQAHLEFGHQVL